MNTPQQLTDRMNKISRLYYVSTLLFVLAVAIFFVIDIIMVPTLGLMIISSATSLCLVLFGLFLFGNTSRRISRLQAELDKLVSPELYLQRISKQ